MSNQRAIITSVFPRVALGALILAAAFAVWNANPSYSIANEALAPRAEGDTPGSFANVIEAVRPAVVNIAVRGRKASTFETVVPGDRLPDGFRFRQERPFGPGEPGGTPFEEFLWRFFDGPADPREFRGRPFAAAGSGFIVDAEGLVVTNYHVVKDAEEITVTTDDGSRHPATLRGYDEKTDLALLDIEGEGLPFVAFGDSDGVRVGDWIVAIGNPFGLGGSATSGIVSARGRDIRSGPFDDFLQIDAPINTGNSGGPLFDLDGAVIGVNTAIFTPNGGNVGIGFAIPASTVEPIIRELRENGRIERGWLGVNVQGIDEEIASGLGLETARGALVAGVVDESPAAAAGLVPGDVIVGFNGEPVDDVRELVRLVGASDPDDAADIEVWRSGETEVLRTRLGEAEEATPGPIVSSRLDEASGLGLRVADIDAATRRGQRLDEGVTGVVVTGVASGGIAAQRGVRPGDIIVGVGQESIDGAEAFRRAVEDAFEEGDVVVLQVLRGGARQFVPLPRG